jgi:putative oxidoreductase
MSALSTLDRPVRLSLRVLAVFAFLAPLLTRVVIGWAFHQTGHGKLEHLDRTIEFFSGLGIPMPGANARFVSWLEFAGGLALVVGLLTRVVAFMLAGSMVVALLTADRAAFVAAVTGSGDSGVTDVSSFVFLLFLSWLVLYGPGIVSLDAVLFRRWRKPVTDTASQK